MAISLLPFQRYHLAGVQPHSLTADPDGCVHGKRGCKVMSSFSLSLRLGNPPTSEIATVICHCKLRKLPRHCGGPSRNWVGFGFQFATKYCRITWRHLHRVHIKDEHSQLPSQAPEALWVEETKRLQELRMEGDLTAVRRLFCLLFGASYSGNRV